jgi:hypothetical protein
MPSPLPLPEPSRWLRRVLLVNPPSGLYRRDGRCQSRVEDQAVRVILPRTIWRWWRRHRPS